MKIMVPIKRVVDYNVKVRPNSDGSDVDLANVKMAINPFCEIAVEEAIRLKERGKADEVVVVCIGPSKAQEQLRAAMALGADRAILVETDLSLEPLAIAKILQKIYDQESPGLVILGKQSIDGDNNQTGQMLAALCGLPQGTFASEVTFNESSIYVTREVDGGLETLELQLPAVVTTDLRLNEPRYAALPNIMKAKKKPLETLAADSIGVDLTPRTKLLSVSTPPERAAGIKVASVDELIEKLKNEAKVIS
ncbi:electron transfer flavoprotein subunit beta/FixA family protein [Teredinibacter turnerae]|uniref:Electron transfer flavoprotein subunit beta n=1 Tax=Teredinibacter turnerae (strain ATCC 39867 / T7901) TaxID=377629 RepID=C5BJC9_TERTT|nr:electron transfer flavoprotein subunit beta/FixA family protein [Teredinibacter turnerae]ACR11995.1 electron transfer flavoprotein, beta subunit [Teredinibacter turnerae T7901]